MKIHSRKYLDSQHGKWHDLGINERLGGPPPLETLPEVKFEPLSQLVERVFVIAELLAKAASGGEPKSESSPSLPTETARGKQQR